uniref:Tn3 family transposase n=1 Tax=Nocardiopsis ganjiahuensis TaxID=239984 RepID=UPI001EFA054E|nr:Tn3 family transposase [Nocardiopsis ganjiahuensis]
MGPGICDRLQSRVLGTEGVLGAVKSDPGPLGLETLLTEIDKLKTVQALGLPDEPFGGVSEKIVAAWRSRAARMYPSDFAECAELVRCTLLAALCWTRQAELIDSLVELLIRLIHRINARAEKRVEKELIGELTAVPGKKGILRRMVDASLAEPGGTVSEVIFSAVPGGEKTLRKLARELMATEKAMAERVRYQLRGSYSHHYRRMLSPLLAALSFRCNNTAYRPVMEAIELLGRYTDVDRKEKFYGRAEHVPIEGVVPKAWAEAVTDQVSGRVERIPYELCVLIALREALRRREIYVEGAGKWRNPDTDLPGDFEDNRDVHYAALKKPVEPNAFVDGVRTRMRQALDRLDVVMAKGTTGGVRIVTRKGQPWISVPKLEALPEPQNLGALKGEVQRRWGTIDLLDILKDTALLTGFCEEFASVATREAIPKSTLHRRLLLCLFALGTNMGIKQMIATGDHGEDEGALRRTRASHITRDNLRRAIAAVVNETFAARDATWWGTATTTASDSKRFGSWESNLMTEFHARYGGHGVMIYWHVDKGRACIYSQLKSCSSSEVAAMIEGVLRHCTDAEVQANYTDTHGASIVGFAFTELLGFKLLPRLKNIGAVRLYSPDEGPATWPHLERVVKNRPKCADCYLKADLGAAARGFVGKAQEMIAAIEVEPAAPAPLVAEWRWWAAKHLQGALAAEQVMDQAGRVEQVLATITERARHLAPTTAEAGRAAAADGVLTLLERGHWAQGWLRHLTGRRPRPLPTAEIAQVGEAFHTWLAGWVRAVAAEHDPAHQGHSTARLTTALTRQITAFTDAYFPAETGRAWRGLGLPVLPPGAQRYGRLDVVLWHPVFAPVVIEIDSAPNRSSAAKLAFARDAGALALWVRFGKGSVDAPEGVPVVDLRQDLAPLHRVR